MPYTPPSSRSPAASNNSSPALSRRSSLLPGQPMVTSPTSSRPDLPRSTSYLTRHRRTPSVKTTSLVENIEPTPPGTADREDDVSALHSSASLRKSPPPVTDRSQMPNGVVLSPPESAQNSGDEEDEKARGRQIEKLAELQAALQQIGRVRESSPSEQTQEIVNDVARALTLQLPKDEEEQKAVSEKVQVLLSPNSRKISHTRSNTDSSLFMGELRRRKDDSSLSETDEEETESSGSDSKKPPMLRKKSGELVRPALRPASRRRPSSMPGTPTFSKAVHFDSHLEHVRHFLQVDRPLAVSAGSSPVDFHNSDTEFPFSDEDTRGTRSLPYEWEIVVANFPPETYERLQMPVRVEKVYLSTDNKTLIGVVAVANIAFNKTVVARFTLDYWKTTSEVVAEYTNDIRRKKQNDGYDRFNFTIKLADLANLEAKTMFFCVKYCVNGVEYWDNNNSTNFQIDFRKKMKPINGKKGCSSQRQSNGLPRSGRRTSPAERTVVTNFDDFADEFSFPYKQPTHEYLSGAGRLKGVRSEVALSSERFQKKPASPSNNAFSNRYDFSASLNAAIQAANTTLGDKSGITMKNTKKVATQTAKPPASSSKPEPAPAASVGGAPQDKGPPLPNGKDQPPLASQSYNDLLDKYCFVRKPDPGLATYGH